ncbi:hypothetical protein PRR79_10360, partial [Klebsiella pneumoniae]|nr:hypothetical protein [Klebsiella pneumoniae]
LERWIKGSAILGCVGCLVGHLFMFLVGGKTPDQSVHLNLTTTEYAALGIDSFIFSGYPHLEEAYRVGELLFPLLDVAVPSIPQPQNLRLQGEAVANEFIPRKVAQS